MTSVAERGSNDISESLRDSAALWHERMHAEQLSDGTRAAFKRWLEDSPRHGEAYAAMERVWAAMGELPEVAPILALRHETALRLTRKTARELRPWRAVAAASTLLLMGIAAYAAVTHVPGLRPLIARIERAISFDRGNRYATGTGERLSFTLADGSQVMLDTQSELEVAFTTAERRVELRRGQAFFEVAKNPARPFVVAVRDRRVIAVGTAFDVRVDDSQLKVTMMEGVVRVEDARADVISGAPEAARAANSSGSQTATVAAGQELIVDHQSRVHIEAADPERSTSWRRGELVFKDARLADAVAEVNRYSPVKISIADPALAEIRISGTFLTGHSTSFVEAVTTYFPIQSSTSGDAVVLSGRR
jgi:transmembrane sensor